MNESSWDVPASFLAAQADYEANLPDEEKEKLRLTKLFKENNLQLPTGLSEDTYLRPSNLSAINVNNKHMNTAQESFRQIINEQSKKEMNYFEQVNNLEELKKLPLEERQRIFKNLMRDMGITSTWRWEGCERVLKTEKMWNVLESFKEKKRLFNEYVDECKTREREQENLRKERIRTRFRAMLEEDETLTSTSKYLDQINKFCMDERWRSIDEKDRENLFQDYLDDLEKREEDEVQQRRDKQVRELYGKLKARNLPASYKWNEAKENLAADSLFARMEKLDTLRAFTSYILDKKAEEEEANARAQRYIQYRNRENFRDMLDEKEKSGELSAKSKFREFINKERNNVYYNNLLGQEGSAPLDLFKDKLEKIMVDYAKWKNEAKNQMKNKNFLVTENTTNEQFNDIMESCKDYYTLTNAQKGLLFKHFLKKAKTAYFIK